MAKGYARPIREIELPAEVAKKLLPEDDYQSAMPIEDSQVWDQTATQLPELWQSEVLTKIK